MKRWLHHKKGLALLLTSSLLINVACAQAVNHAQLLPEKHIKTAKQEMSKHTEDLRALMLILYDQNPEELAKSTQVGAREMTEWVFEGKANWKFEGIRRQQGAQAIALVFDPDFKGDHILALVVGIETLLFNAYGGTNEFDIPVVQDQQKQRHVACALQRLVQKMVSQTAVDTPSSILALSHSSQEIQNTLHTLIKRIESNQGNTSQLVCPMDTELNALGIELH